MSTPRWQQLDQIFADAQQLSRDERIEFVSRACGADEGLRVDILSLLTAADESSEFMARPALDQLAEAIGHDELKVRTGERIGAYTVDRLLGAGGAGVVWRARDERLGRHVAIKFMSPHFSNDAERVRRFLDEARAAGALNHPNVLAIYDVGEHGGVPFIVSECLEGESLYRRLERGPLPVQDALQVALEIAHGLAAAHARGIVHRDLKPDNVFLCSNRGVKILDFGVAKLQLPPADEVRRPTSQTTIGVIVGTAGYMSPEQVRGEKVDTRTDLFALGATLYEMVSGLGPFKRDTVIETLHAILTTDPPDLSNDNQEMPPALTDIVKRLLAKAPDERFQSAVDLAWTLERALAVMTERATSYARSRSRPKQSHVRWFRWIAAVAGVVMLAGLTWWLQNSVARPPMASILTRFTWSLPPGVGLNSAPIVSPDGQTIVFSGNEASGSRLFVHNFDSLEPRVVAGTEGAKQPFWSPDGKSVGFFARGKLRKVALAGGAPVVVADALDGRGGTWNRAGVIVFCSDLVGTSLSKVSASGGQVEPVTILDVENGDNSHRWPMFLPDGVHFLYFNLSTNDSRRGVYLGRIDRPASKPDVPLFLSESEAVFAPLPETGGALLYIANGRVEVRRFDPARLAFIGDPQALSIEAGGNTPYHTVMLSASSNALAFAESSVPFGGRLGSAARTGDVRFAAEREAQNWPRVSPDGRRLALQRIDPVRSNPDIWVKDLERGTQVRVTTATEPDILPAWSPDGKRLAFVSGNPPNRPGKRELSIAAADGTGVMQALPCPGEYCEVTDWTHNGRGLIVNVRDARSSDVWIVETDPGVSPQRLLGEAFTERDARISPDGEWIAYVSEESGRPEVSVRNLSGSSVRYVISGGGGDQPVWSRNGAELFFVNPQGRLHTVQVRKTGTSRFEIPVELKVPPIGFGHWGTQYDVSPDGQQVYFVERGVEPSQLPHEIGVLLGWSVLLK
jgi:serine/threonine protein kinase